MNGNRARFFRLAISLAVLVTVGYVLTVQAARPTRQGVPLPTDWTHYHVIFSRPATVEQAARVGNDPRYWQQVARQQQVLRVQAPPQPSLFSRILSRLRHPATTKNFHRDWSQVLGSGGSAGAGNYPAKFTFATNTAYCDAHLPIPDYVVYSTGLAGSGTQASIVAFDNLYSGCLTGTVPMSFFAYNTGGQILTSPVLSLDGTQVAFMQTNAGAASLVVLRWHKGDGSVGAPVAPTVESAATYPGCTAPCMVQVPIFTTGGITPLDDPKSSVFYDYASDVAWVGSRLGWLHKFTGVFKGQPTWIDNGIFPSQISPGTDLGSPVYDSGSNTVFVSDSGGFLNRVDLTTGLPTKSAQLDFSNRTLIGGPIIDASAGLVYAFGDDDGTTNCGGATVGCNAVYQFPATFLALSGGTKAVVGASNLAKFPNPLLMGGFDSAYYASTPASPTGNLYVCGNTGANATLYQIPITSGAMSTTATTVTPLTTAGSTAACSGVINVPNPNQPPVPSERLFVSVANNAVSSPCGGGGCILSFVSGPWKPTHVYVVGEQILSPQMHVETVMTAGTSAIALNQPAWSTQIATTLSDGPNTLVWIDQGALTSPFTTWVASNNFAIPLVKILDPNGNVQALTTTGTSGLAQPAWSTTIGAITADNTAAWTNVGALGTAALPVAGGTSEIIIDNVLGTATVPGDSEVYFTTLTNQTTNCGSVATPSGCAVQASQTGLQ